MLSSVGVKDTVPVVAPALIVMSSILPLPSVQSVPSVAVPEVSKATVIVESVAPDKVAVNVKDDPAFSAILVALTASVTAGADSFYVIVIVTACVPFSDASAPDTPSIEIIAVSLPS